MACHELDRLAASSVGVIGNEQFISTIERKRAQHRVDAGGGVRYEHQVGAVHAQERRKRIPRRVNAGGEVTG